MSVKDILLLAGIDEVPTRSITYNVEKIIDELLHPIHDIFNVQGHQRTSRVHNKGYFEIAISKFTDNQFKEHFRMTRVTCEELINIIGNKIRERQNDVTPLSKKILLTLWIISKPESFLAAGDRFNISSSSAHYIFKEIIMILSELRYEYIKWPSASDRQRMAKIFKIRSCGMRGIIGIIGGCHIPCKQPVKNANDYYNRKGFCSIILQGVCDHRARFIDCYVGLPGGLHNARVFRNSPIFKRLTDQNNPLLSKDEHLIGDSTYPLMQNLLTPFIDTDYLTKAEVNYNTRLGLVHSTMKQAVGHLKGQMRKLKYLDIADFETGNNVIAAACVLHNFIIDNDGLYDCDIDNDSYMEINETIKAENNEENFQAIEKRNNIVAMLYHCKR